MDSVEGFGRKSLIIGLLQGFLPWICLRLDFLSGTNPGGLLDRISDLAGNWIPKARWYSAVFKQQGMETLATQLTRLYGLNALIFVAFLAAYLAYRLRTRRTLVERAMGGEILIGQKARLEQIQRIVIVATLLTAYYDFIGFGLSPNSHSGEGTDGHFILQLPLVFFPVLLIGIVYIYESRIFLKTVKTLP
jgi:hypothetical protein